MLKAELENTLWNSSAILKTRQFNNMHINFFLKSMESWFSCLSVVNKMSCLEKRFTRLCYRLIIAIAGKNLADL